MRLFIAFPVPETVRRLTIEACQLGQKKYPLLPARWIQPHNVHVSLEFLGSLHKKQVQTVREILIYLTKKVPLFLFNTLGLVSFPNVYNHLGS